jgi:hypothetical protein
MTRGLIRRVALLVMPAVVAVGLPAAAASAQDSTASPTLKRTSAVASPALNTGGAIQLDTDAVAAAVSDERRASDSRRRQWQRRHPPLAPP